MPKQLFVTGCYRSGTTLTEKVLHAYPEVNLASQPFPILLFFVKERFLAERGIDRRYPLDHQFRETAYRPADFTEFLERFVVQAEDLDAIGRRLMAYTRGLWTREVLEVLPSVAPGPLLSVWKGLSERLASALGRPSALIVGTKEVLGEEFIPFILRGNGYVVHVLRDPRDMITSLNMRDYDNLTGDPRPILYSIRLWRKSVAYALTAETHGAHVIRYEDLVRDPAGAMTPIARHVGATCLGADDLGSRLVDQSGDAWSGNSSFGGFEGVSTASVGRYHTKLPEDTIRYIETVTAPEMEIVGYRRSGLSAMTEAELLAFEEPTPVTHSAFDPEYSRAPVRIASERRRLEMLAESPNESETREWFIFPDVFLRLSGSTGH